MADMGHVDPDLMGPAGLQPALQKASYSLGCGVLAATCLAALPAITFQHQPMRHRLTSPLTHSHLVARMGMTIDRPVDRAARLVGSAPDKRQIAAPQRP